MSTIDNVTVKLAADTAAVVAAFEEATEAANRLIAALNAVADAAAALKIELADEGDE